MSHVHQQQACGLCLVVVMVLLQSVPSVANAQMGRVQSADRGQDNPALLSVLDPDAVYSAPGQQGATYPVQPASFQDSGIVTTATVPQRTKPSSINSPTANSKFPYQLTATKQVAVRSGPAASSYATDYLKPGQSVDVYRHDPDGWLAIRPPAGSFSLVRAADARKTAKAGVYQIAKNQVKAWVGTRVEQTHQPMTQVRLKTGELVALQSTIEVEEASGTQVWLQIDPPAGEFRWVHLSDFRSDSHPVATTQRTPQALEYQQTSAATLNASYGGVNQQHSGRDSSVSSSANLGSNENVLDVPPLELVGSEPDDAWRAAQRDTPELGYSDYAVSDSEPADNRLADVDAGVNAESPFQNVGYRDASESGEPVAPIDSRPQQPTPANQWDEAGRRLCQNKSGFYQQSNNPVSTPPVAQSPVTSNDWNQYLNRLNQQLSQEIVKPAEQWQLAPLLQQSQALIQSAPSTTQKDAAATLQKRILGFLQLQQQQPGKNDLTAGVAGARYASAANNYMPAGNANAVQQVGYENPYAAVGYLKELIIDRGKQPSSYVLQDATGKTLCHVSPLPGVQLHQYLDQKIGVKGKPGYHAQFRLPHVSVESFDRLD